MTDMTEGTRSMLRGVLGFLPLVLNLAGIFLGLALRHLSLALSLLAQTHDWLLLCPAAPALPHTDRVPQLSCRRRGAPVAPCSTRGEAQTFPISRLSVAARRSPCAARSTRGRRHVPHLLPRARTNNQYRSAGLRAFSLDRLSLSVMSSRRYGSLTNPLGR